MINIYGRKYNDKVTLKFNEINDLSLKRNMDLDYILQKRKGLLEISEMINQKQPQFRSIVVAIDMSKASFSNDLQPTKLKLCLEEIKSFITDFTEENPLSQISLISTHYSKSELIFNFVTSIKQMLRNIKHFDKKGGQFSILNTILVIFI